MTAPTSGETQQPTTPAGSSNSSGSGAQSTSGSISGSGALSATAPPIPAQTFAIPTASAYVYSSYLVEKSPPDVPDAYVTSVVYKIQAVCINCYTPSVPAVPPNPAIPSLPMEGSLWVEERYMLNEANPSNPFWEKSMAGRRTEIVTDIQTDPNWPDKSDLVTTTKFSMESATGNWLLASKAEKGSSHKLENGQQYSPYLDITTDTTINLTTYYTQGGTVVAYKEGSESEHVTMTDYHIDLNTGLSGAKKFEIIKFTHTKYTPADSPSMVGVAAAGQIVETTLSEDKKNFAFDGIITRQFISLIIEKIKNGSIPLKRDETSSVKEWEQFSAYQLVSDSSYAKHSENGVLRKEETKTVTYHPWASDPKKPIVQDATYTAYFNIAGVIKLINSVAAYLPDGRKASLNITYTVGSTSYTYKAIWGGLPWMINDLTIGTAHYTPPNMMQRSAGLAFITNVAALFPGAGPAGSIYLPTE